MAISRNRQRFLKEVLWGHMRSGVGGWDSQVWKHTMRGEEASVDELTLGWRDWQGWFYQVKAAETDLKRSLNILFCTSSQHINLIFVCCSWKHRRVSFADHHPEESCKHPLPARGGLLLDGIISITSEVITWTPPGDASRSHRWIFEEDPAATRISRTTGWAEQNMPGV